MKILEANEFNGQKSTVHIKGTFKISQKDLNLMSETYKWRHLNGTISGDGYIL
jgi:hypothetical protein